jgi:hypothetical protein
MDFSAARRRFAQDIPLFFTPKLARPDKPSLGAAGSYSLRLLIQAALPFGRVKT